MVSSLLTRLLFLFVLLCTALLPGLVNAQDFTNAGTRFAFGIPEGPDRQTPTGTIDRQSRIFLTIVAQDSGCAVVTSPNGFYARVEFPANRQREIEIDHAYMQIYELGKNRKGFLVESTQPIHLEVHVLFDGASESTQIFPMEVLDRDYIISGWSLWNDVFYGENNRAQFIVTAAEDNTDITIRTPSGLLPNIAPGTTFNVTLNAGECYIGKMDSTLERTRTTSNVTVSATKPVNVIVGSTCAYVPFGVQSCNMLIDNILPTKYFGKEFYLQPISPAVNNDQLLLTGLNPNFAVVLSDGSSYSTSSGRVTLFLDKPSQIITSEPVMVQVLTQGSTLAQAGLSDPTWVTVYPVELWDDTLVWYAPPTVAGMDAFTHFITILGPQSALSNIRLDNNNIAALGTARNIPGSSMFSMQLGVTEGTHRLKSPVSISAIATGFKGYDGYSILPGGVLPSLPRTLPPTAQLTLSNSNAVLCQQFTSQLGNTLQLTATDRVVSVLAQITYDQNVLRLISANAGAFFQGVAGVIVRTGVPGLIEVEVTSPAPLTGSGSLIDAVFEVMDDVPASSLQANVTLTTDRICDNERQATESQSLAITKEIELGRAQVWLADFAGEQNTTVSSDLFLSDLQADAEVATFDVLVTWDHDYLDLRRIVQTGGMTDGWTVARVDETPTTTRLTFTAPTGEFLSNGKLATLEFQTFLAPASSTTVTAGASFESGRFCPLSVTATDSVSTFSLGLDCGDEIVQNILNGTPLVSRITPNPARDHINLELNLESDLSAILVDEMGRQVAGWNVAGKATNRLNLPAGIASGYYVLRLEGIAGIQNVPVLIQK